MRRALRWLAPALGAALALALLVWSVAPEALPPGARLVDAASFVRSDAPAPPAAGWSPRALPDDWRHSEPGRSGYGWYRMSVHLDAAPGDAWGAYLSHVSTTYQLFVNGTEVGTGGGMSGDIRRLGGRPQFDPVAAQLLHSGRNELLLRLRVASNLRGGLGPIMFGPRQAVEAAYARAYFLRVTLPRAVNLALLFAGLLVALLWLRHPRETLHGHFAALAVLWSLRNFHYTMAPDVPSVLWEAFVLGSLGVVLLLLWRFMLRFTGQQAPRLEPVLTRVFLLAPLAFLVAGEQLASRLRIGWYLACAGLGVLAIATLLRFLHGAAAARRRGGWLILGAMVMTLLLGLTDLAVSAGLLPFGPAARMAFGAPLLLAAMVLAMADNYFATFEQARMRNAELEQRVRERTRALEAAHARVEALARAHAVDQERERLTRDMHDGVGSQLMTALAAVERGELGAAGVAALLRDCIADLRLVIDSLDADERSLALALANLRWRIEPRLEAAGIRLQWAVAPAPAPSAPGTVLQVLRIVQEALVNAIKHSGASQLRVALEPREDALHIEVSDNGRGLAAADTPAPAAARRGVENMRLRARQIGARLALESTPAGTTVALAVPLDTA